LSILLAGPIDYLCHPISAYVAIECFQVQRLFNYLFSGVSILCGQRCSGLVEVAIATFFRKLAIQRIRSVYTFFDCCQLCYPLEECTVIEQLRLVLWDYCYRIAACCRQPVVAVSVTILKRSSAGMFADQLFLSQSTKYSRVGFKKNRSSPTG